MKMRAREKVEQMGRQNEQTLGELYSLHNGKVSDKWASYLPNYQRVLEPFRFASVRLLEIGIQNGGSLEIWAKFFAHATAILGCDINPACAQLRFDDPRIQIVVGDANSDEAAETIASLSPEFDIIIDDGSHRSGDIVRSFARYFGRLKDGGVFIAEDLHCSYWSEFEGGLLDPMSAMSFFKRLADVINHEHWGVPHRRAPILRSFEKHYGFELDESQLSGIHSVEFLNSICVVRKKAAGENLLGAREVVGSVAIVDGELLASSKGSTLEAPDQSSNKWSMLSPLPEDELSELKDAVVRWEADRKMLTEVRGRLAQLEVDSAALSEMRVAVAQLEVEMATLDSEKEGLRASLQLREQELCAQKRQLANYQHASKRLQLLFDAATRREGALRFELDAKSSELDLIVRSKAWRAASKVRALARRHPRLASSAWKALKAGKLLGNLELDVLGQSIERYRQRAATKREIHAAGLFDADYYRAQMSGPIPRDLLGHYLAHGEREGMDPSAFFDVGWYLSRYPDVASSGMSALVHYMRHPRLSPNPLFDGEWYLQTYEDVARAGCHPLTHYLEYGAAEGRDPMSGFSTIAYRNRHPELTHAGADLLAHALAHRAEYARESEGAPVTSARIYCAKSPAFGSEAALFVAHSPDGKLKPHVPHYLESLRAAGISVILLVAADDGFEVTAALSELVDGIFVRENVGYDFAIWAHVLRLHSDLLNVDLLYLINDSLIGPFTQASFDNLLNTIRVSDADVIGLTSNVERGAWHLQSYFLALRAGALRSVAFQNFIRKIRSFKDKDDVINSYELRLAGVLRDAGLVCMPIYASTGPRNPTIYEWRSVILAGVPFVKVMTLRDSFAGVDISDWEEVLASNGYDIELAKQTLQQAKAGSPSAAGIANVRLTQIVASSDLERPLRVSFIGPMNFDNGLGVASRSYVSALRRTGWELNLHPIKFPFHIHRQICPPVDVCDFEGDADIVIVHLNPDGWKTVLTDTQKTVISAARFRIGLWVWETSEIPESWKPIVAQVDAIWVPSSYAARAFAAFSDIPLQIVPHVVPIPPISFGRVPPLPASIDRYILYAFDGSSYLKRKNPFALVNAFNKSGLNARGWSLVLKTKHLGGAEGESLKAAMNSTQGAVVLDQPLDRQDMRALFEQASIYASPHSSEGFGLTVAEAMALGKSVVATDYSGTTDFLDASCGYPVAFNEHALESSDGAYSAGSSWAAVDELALAEALLRAAADLDAGDDSKMQNARVRIRSKLSVDSIAETMKTAVRALVG